jgi:hypothetical protein
MVQHGRCGSHKKQGKAKEKAILNFSTNVLFWEGGILLERSNAGELRFRLS